MRLRTAQAAAVILLAGAAAVAAVGVPGIGGDRPDEEIGVEAVLRRADELARERQATRTAQTPETEVVGLAAAAERLQLTKNAPRPPALAAERADAGPTGPVPDTTPPDQPLASGPSIDLRYLGLVREPTRNLALLAMGQTQRILGEGAGATVGAGPGQSPAEVRVVSILDDRVRVSVNGVEREVMLAARSGPTITTAAASPAPSAAAPTRPEMGVRTRAAGGAAGDASSPLAGGRGEAARMGERNGRDRRSLREANGERPGPSEREGATDERR